MNKRVVSVESKESSDGSDFQVLPSPMATLIEEKYQALLGNGKTAEEALRILMNQVNSEEMPIFLEWMNARMTQLSSTV